MIISIFINNNAVWLTQLVIFDAHPILLIPKTHEKTGLSPQLLIKSATGFAELVEDLLEELIEILANIYYII